MSGPLFLLQIVRTDNGEVARFPGGTALERDLVESLVKAIGQKPVGLFRTRTQVEAAAREAITQVLRDLKEETRTLVYKAPL